MIMDYTTRKADDGDTAAIMRVFNYYVENSIIYIDRRVSQNKQYRGVDEYVAVGC